VRICRTAAVACVAAVSVVAVSATEEATLRYRWAQGDVVIYRTSLKTTSTVSGMPNMGDLTLEQTMTQRIKLLAAAVAPDGSATLHQTTEAVSVEMGTPTGKIKYDSADPKTADDNEAALALRTVFAGMVGATISITMTANGTIQRIDGIQKVLEKVTQDIPQDRATGPMIQNLKLVLSEEAVRASLEQSFPRLPPQPVKAGDTWTGQIALGSSVIGRISGAQTFTLKTLGGGGVATVAVALALKQESAPPMGPSGMTVKLGDSKGDGEIEFDVARGRIRKSTMKTDMPSTMTTVAPDGRQATMKNTTQTSMTMELVEK
jgi:Family of unknown function (DUF6263)